MSACLDLAPRPFSGRAQPRRNVLIRRVSWINVQRDSNSFSDPLPKGQTDPVGVIGVTLFHAMSAYKTLTWNDLHAARPKASTAGFFQWSRKEPLEAGI